MKKIEWHRIFAFVFAFALILVYASPVLVASAASINPVLPALEQTCRGLTGLQLPSGVSDPVFRYDTVSFNDSTIVNRLQRYFVLDDNVSSSEHSNVDRSLTIVGKKDYETFLYSSFMKGPGVYKPFSNVFEIPVYFLYEDEPVVFTDLSFNITYFYDIPGITLSSTVYFKFYDAAFNEVENKAGVFFMSGTNIGNYSRTYPIPENAVYFDVFVLSGFRDMTDNVEYTFGLDNIKFAFYAHDASYIEPSEPSDPTEPSDPSGSGGNTGGSTGDNTGGSSGGSSSGGLSDSAVEDIVTGFNQSIGGLSDSISQNLDDVKNAIWDVDDSLTGIMNQSRNTFNEVEEVNENLDEMSDQLDTMTGQIDTIIGSGHEGDKISSGSGALSSDISGIQSFEEDAQSLFDDNIGIIQNDVDFSSFVSALEAVYLIANAAFESLGIFRILYSFPMFLGLFFFLCNRAPGAVRAYSVNKYRADVRQSRSSNLNAKGGAS